MRRTCGLTGRAVIGMGERRNHERRRAPALPPDVHQIVGDAFNGEQVNALERVWGLNARTLEEIQGIVRGQWRTLMIGLGLIAVIALAAGVLSVSLLTRQGRTVANVRANQQHIAELARTNRRLIAENLGLEKSTRANQAANTHALCSLRADVQKRVTAGRSFLRAHPDGIPGISAPTLQASTDNSQRTVDALSSLVCPK